MIKYRRDVMIFHSEQELIKYTKNIIGKTFKEIDSTNLLKPNSKDKGILGKVVEEGFYGYPTNSVAKADFDNLGIELKTTGFVTSKTGLKSSKERLSLSMIDYNSLVHEDFEFSKLLFKNKKLLIIWYEYKKGVNQGDFLICDFQLYDMSIDENTIRNDFYIIKNKVLNGNAHLLSEGDTSYLGAATKAAHSNIKTLQPYSSIPAKPRCFSLKKPYMTGILRDQNIVNPNFLSFNFSNTVLDFVKRQYHEYFGLTQIEIAKKLGISLQQTDTEYAPKNIGKMISDRIMGKDEELYWKSDLFRKTTYIIKNISVDDNFMPCERLSFRNLMLSEFEEEWENSYWKNYFEEVSIVLVCYEGKGLKNGFRKLKDVKQITFSSCDIDLFELSYNMVRESIYKRDISLLPYPDKFSKPTIVIAPKGNKGDDAYINFFSREVTKTCFMLDKQFVFNKIIYSGY